MLTDDKIKKIIIKSNLLGSSKDAKDILTEAEKNNDKDLADYVIEKKLINESSLYESVAKYFNLPFVNLESKKIDNITLFLVPETSAQEHQTVAFNVNNDKKTVDLATLDPENIEFFEFIHKKTSLEPIIHICTPNGLKKALAQFHTDTQAEFKMYDKNRQDISEKKLTEMSQELPIIRIVDSLLEQAFYEKASDIHIEPEEKETKVRYRIDGILSNVMTLPKKAHAPIVARIKVMSNLKVDEHRLPQDGRFKIYNKKNKISFRVSIIPVIYGEKIVMRLLDEKPGILSLEEIGLQPSSLEIVKKNIKKPHGMILITGPTGSGKTTTLYTVINILNSPKVNISTIEDPIEYNIPHVNQSQVSPKIGYTFANGLRAFLRQDPDIIMVGEIRDNETAEIAIHAALTGHLVLSSLHTNDALTTLPRLLEMNVPPFLVASTTNVIIAQRLVRRICKNCIYSYYLDKKEIEQLKKDVDIEKIIQMLKNEKIISKKEEGINKLLFYKGKGCPECGNSGYKGRIGIYETLEITPELAKLIAGGASESEMRKEEERQNILKMIEDGFIKAKAGITTIEEVLRVTKE
ncbi:hypothetical protein COT95_02355 [Candidatus Falkowbacteria bacterium CG10_big_fil_rev_8_21_14_0_10_37_6]|uniref:Bacterial type II secretion system protein E domain-containing protein n=1 Tax=Candidatus Falkowbacteria bacterium CG10_big_fil_rev_8_21_14_0_10_37_6 TaxID=1974563 RepID=A0A2H0V6U7_9BACT|nr:MAG: hypothetical protein COT95_02355 [Candidatus Falkowbacteria bacterium CG10_big_fil_rev_8_21_14_0_10_37_6]